MYEWEMNVRKCNLKQQWETTVHLLECLKLEKDVLWKNSFLKTLSYTLFMGIWNAKFPTYPI